MLVTGMGVILYFMSLAQTETMFWLQVLESISFLSFVASRGPPYRSCDLFDQV